MGDEDYMRLIDATNELLEKARVDWQFADEFAGELRALEELIVKVERKREWEQKAREYGKTGPEDREKEREFGEK